MTLPSGVLVYPPSPPAPARPYTEPHPPKSVFEAAPSDAASCTVERLSTRVSVVAASRNLRSPTTEAPILPSGPSLRPAILAPAPRPPESLLLKTMLGLRV